MVGRTVSMLKRACLIVALAIPHAASAGGYYPGVIDHYDGASGLYFRTLVTKQLPKGLISSYDPKTIVSNLNIFNPENQISSLFFDEAPKGEITDILFESGMTAGRIDVISMGGDLRFKHNVNLPEDRTPRDKLLVGVKDDKDNTTLYVANKHGENRVVLTVVPAGSEWHIDAANGKLRVVRQDEGKLIIESFDW